MKARNGRRFWVDLFLEYAVAALAEAVVAAAGWILRKVWKWWRGRKKPKPDEDPPC